MAQLTIQQCFDLALQHHQAGHLREAEDLYRQILAQQPDHADALHFSGVIAHQTGRHDIAADLIRRAVALDPKWPEAHNNLGEALRAQGQSDQAIAAYRQAITLDVGFPEAHNNLGNALREKGQLDEAIAACRQAIALKPDYLAAYNNLGNALRDKGRMEQAIAAYRQALAINPGFPDIHANLGLALQADGQMDQAITAYRQAIALKPNYAEAYANLGHVLKAQGRVNEAIAAYGQAIALRPDDHDTHNRLGVALQENGELDQAIAAYRQAIALKPDYAAAYSNLGDALRVRGRLDEAIAACRRAIAISPDLASAHNHLGNALREHGSLDEAIAAFGQAIALKPEFAAAHSNLGNALQASGRLDDAMAAYRQAIAIKPDLAATYGNLGNVLQLTGRLDEGIAAHRQAVALDPDNARLDSTLLYAIHFHPGYDAEAILLEHRRWNQRHAEPLKTSIRPHDNDRSPDRRLRIGYVSPDFREHVVGRNLVPLLSRHDHRQYEVFAYSSVLRQDSMTGRFRACADHWQSIVGLPDPQVAELIRNDGVDILVDLSLHMAENRLLIFARKPAPVQVTFAGYPGTTGLDAMDYRLTDPYLDPPGLTDSRYSESSVRLPDSFWCFDPLGDQAVGNSLPALEAGRITFGCLNNFAKVSQPTLRLWAGVMNAVTDSRLLLLAPEGRHRQRCREMLGSHGVAPERVEFVSSRPRGEYLELYHRIDIGLDTLPYNGHSTSLDSFWMGVPVITLVGQTVVGRAGLCQLMNLGLGELAADSPEQFVRIAAELAGDLPRLAELRRTLRPRMEASPLMDAPKFARSIEVAYLAMWKTWCSCA